MTPPMGVTYDSFDSALTLNQLLDGSLLMKNYNEIAINSINCDHDYNGCTPITLRRDEVGRLPREFSRAVRRPLPLHLMQVQVNECKIRCQTNAQKKEVEDVKGEEEEVIGNKIKNRFGKENFTMNMIYTLSGLLEVGVLYVRVKRYVVIACGEMIDVWLIFEIRKLFNIGILLLIRVLSSQADAHNRWRPVLLRTLNKKPSP